MLTIAYSIMVTVLTIALATVTVLPASDLQEWWVRAMDFPRIHFLIAAAIVAVLCLFLPGRLGAPTLAVALACTGVQAWKVFPYTPLASKEIRLAPEGDDQMRFLAANVLMENREHQAVLDLIRREMPETIFLMETDQTWVDALEPALDGYSTVIARPQDNHYGLVFATNLEVIESHLLDLGDADKPTLFAELKDGRGRAFRFVGLHPPPPLPGQDTHVRDAKIAYTARFARKAEVPLLIMGDFNQPAWSHMAQRFKRIGGYLDPRIGRGPLPSFDATQPLLRFPIDQLYITPNLALVDFARGNRIGSDHFPMLATVRIAPDLAEQFNTAPNVLDPDEEAGVQQLVDEYGATLEVDIRSQ